MASQKLTGRAASMVRRRMQVSGKGGASSAPAVSAPARSSAQPAPAPVTRTAAAKPATASGQSAARKASLERRAALSSRGKGAVRSSDRQRSQATASSRTDAPETGKGACGCGGDCCKGSKPETAPTLTAPAGNSGKVMKRQRAVSMPTGRLVSKARRNALASKGKVGMDAHRKGISSASLARQANPDISGRELARAVRERRSRAGAQGATSAQPARRRPRNAAEAQRVSGTRVGHSGKLTGDESGLCHGGITGTEYMAAEIFNEFCQGEAPKAPVKVERSETLGGSRVTTGGRVGGGGKLTGAERGECRVVTGSEYLGREHFERVCDTTPSAGAGKVSQSQTHRGTVISGPRSSRSEKVSGNEKGTCRAVTGTPYAGFEQYEKFCSPEQQQETRRVAPLRPSGAGREISGMQPGIKGNRLTGAGEGACQSISGTPYLAATEVKEVCGAVPAKPGEGDFPQPLAASEPSSDALPAQAPQSPSRVTGSGYEGQGPITGAFSMGRGKVTGTEQFRFGDRAGNVITVELEAGEPEAEHSSRVTGEGIDTGLRITGDDWDRGDRVTGTEGTSATRRNPTRRGPVSAMPRAPEKREPQRERPSANVTGSSGGSEGAAVTVSGGARG